MWRASQCTDPEPASAWERSEESGRLASAAPGVRLGFLFEVSGSGWTHDCGDCIHA
jgi:hypothetical protein